MQGNIEVNRINSMGAETALVALLIKYPEKMIEIRDIVESQDFSSPNLSGLFKALDNLIIYDEKTNIDKPLLMGKMSELGLGPLAEKMDNEKFLDAIFNYSEPDKANIENFAAKIKKMAIKREIYKSARQVQIDMISDSTETVEQIISKAEEGFLNSVKKLIKSDNTQLITDGIEDLLDKRANSPRENIGIRTPFPLYNKAIGGGLRRQALDILVGRGKAGKSSWLLTVAGDISIRQNIPTLYVDTEMCLEDYQTRLVSQISQVEMLFLENGLWRRDVAPAGTKEKVDRALKLIKDKPFYYRNVCGQSPEMIANVIRHWVLKYVGKDETGNTKDCLVVFDYIKVMAGSTLRDVTEWQSLGFQVTLIKDLATKLDIPILSAVQMNRQGVKASAEQLDESVIAASDRISWYSTSCSAIGAKTAEEEAADGVINGNTKLVTLVSRYGPGMGGTDYVNYRFNKSVVSFEELKSKSEIIDNIKKIKKPKEDKPF
jgi:replicative DNA helicase